MHTYHEYAALSKKPRPLADGQIRFFQQPAIKGSMVTR